MKNALLLRTKILGNINDVVDVQIGLCYQPQLRALAQSTHTMKPQPSPHNIQFYAYEHLTFKHSNVRS